MEKKEILNVIKALALNRAPSGLEQARGAELVKQIKTYAKISDGAIIRDNYNNVILKIRGKNAKKGIAILGHLDEIGGTIRRINDNGTLCFSMRGGYEGRWLVSRKIQIYNKEREWINGIIAGRSVHITPEKVRLKEKIDPLDLEIFIGAENKEDVIEKYKLHVGAPFVFQGEFGLLNPSIDSDLVSGYSIDDLAALTCLVILANKLTNITNDFGVLNIPHDLYLVGTSREEIGTEGAYHFLRESNVEKVIGVDIAPLGDFTGSTHSGIKLKGGPVIVWQEFKGSGVFDYEFCSQFIKIAEKSEIEYQNGVFENYGSDAGKAQKWLGNPSVLIGIPSLFSHNVPEVCSLEEIQSAANLIFQYLKSLK